MNACFLLSATSEMTRRSSRFPSSSWLNAEGHALMNPECSTHGTISARMGSGTGTVRKHLVPLGGAEEGVGPSGCQSSFRLNKRADCCDC